MPCFHTHWLVALAASVEAPDYVQAGRQAYLRLAASYRDSCLAVLSAGDLTIEADPNGRRRKKSKFINAMEAAHAEWEKDVRGDPKANGKNANQDDIDAMTCFSAYMLGACGPDFWMVPSVPKTVGLVPSFGNVHFDLGHYNRTHRQFELSIARAGGPKHVGLQSLVQRSYFLGMATHIAADLVIHQLVNVTAGAYNLLEKTWNNEHGGDWGMHIWNTHNKVEHFWDSYVRYRYLGDYGPFWPEGDADACDAKDWFKPMDFPTVDGLLKRVDTRVPEKSRASVRDYLRLESTRFAIEKPLMFPWLFCDRVLAGEIKPFIYSIVVDKKTGAYPTERATASENALSGDMRKEAQSEAFDAQMRGPAGPGEHHKLEHFCSAKNVDTDTTSFNYVTFKVCPNVERTKTTTKQFLPNSFYDYRALRAFFLTGAHAAAKFLGELSHAYESGNPAYCHKLRTFWNLDTGLGLRVRQKPSHTNRETITELDFVHVFEELGTGNPAYHRRQPYLNGKSAREDYPCMPSSKRAFKIHAPEQPFPNVESISEPHHDEYLDELRVEHQEGGDANARTVRTSHFQPVNTLAMSRIRHRLNLRLRAPIADLLYRRENDEGQYAEKLALFFESDKDDELKAPSSKETKKWLAKESKSLDYREVPTATHKGLQVFATRLLVNTEDETAGKAKSEKREISQGSWNNVIPYSEHEGHYGRNFAIGTGRQYVLHPERAEVGYLNPSRDMSYYKNLSPTEHVFFTLFSLVRKGEGYWDIFSKEDIPGSKLAELKQISGLGTVKIVLIYERTKENSLNLCEAYIDGLKVHVEK